MAGMLGRVFLDANVLYSRTVRDWLGLIYTDDLVDPPFLAFWSEDVLSEAIYHLRQNNPTWDGAKIAAVRDRIAGTFEGGRVTDYVVDGSYPGGDQKDAHVHGACLACDADYLLTENGRDFTPGAADELPYEVVAPDAFFLLVDDAAPDMVDRAVRKQIMYWSAKTEDVDLGRSLRRANCSTFAARVTSRLQ